MKKSILFTLLGMFLLILPADAAHYPADLGIKNTPLIYAHMDHATYLAADFVTFLPIDEEYGLLWVQREIPVDFTYIPETGEEKIGSFGKDVIRFYFVPLPAVKEPLIINIGPSTMTLPPYADADHVYTSTDGGTTWRRFDIMDTHGYNMALYQGFRMGLHYAVQAGIK